MTPTSSSLSAADFDFDPLAKSLQPHYSRFDVANRLLFTGHSHQAWPDVAFEGVQKYMDTAANQVDKKWGAAAEKVEVLRGYLRDWYDDPDGLYCREANTHMLLVSWLSSLDLLSKPTIITTAQEFHSMYRQLEALRPLGLNVITLDGERPEELPALISTHLDGKVSAIMLSRVYFESSRINTALADIAAIGRAAGVPVMVDDYHGTNVVPLRLREQGLEDLFLLIGGYKYLQWGEGNCFLRFPRSYSGRPFITGWFSAFGSLDSERIPGSIPFDEGDQRFASATHDPVSAFRAEPVVDFFSKMELTPQVLRQQYQSQLKALRDSFTALDLDAGKITLRDTDPVEHFGGFMALRSTQARELCASLHKKGVLTDARGDILRFGAAPYITRSQIDQAMGILSECVRELD